MRLQKECLSCIAGQAERVCTLLEVDEKQRQTVLKTAQEHIANFDLNQTPPFNAAPLYEDIAKLLGVEDIYKDFKKESSKKAKAFVPFCESKIKNSQNKLFDATKTAIAGNVIDLGAGILYDLEEELQKIYTTPFAIDDFSMLEEALSRASSVVYLADNAGEEIFDKLYIETIRELYPSINIYYFVRGRPIINDLTYAEALSSGLDSVSTVIDSGVPTPGLTIELMKKEAREIFYKADLIISKGMGNYECLGDTPNLPIFFLFKVKCKVVARAAGACMGDIVCKKGI